MQKFTNHNICLILAVKNLNFGPAFCKHKCIIAAWLVLYWNCGRTIRLKREDELWLFDHDGELQPQTSVGLLCYFLKGEKR